MAEHTEPAEHERTTESEGDGGFLDPSPACGEVTEPAEPPGRPVIEVRDVTFGYGKVPVIEGVSLAVYPREFLALLGPNGGGKTTLVKIILGLLEPWSGEVIFHLPEPGRSPGEGSRKAEAGRGLSLGYVPQYPTFDTAFPLRVSDAVLMGRLGRRGLIRRYTAADRRRAAEVIERLGLGSLARKNLSELSGGQLQRVLIARALVSDPAALFLDEPTASIDAESRQVLKDILFELNREIPIVIVTHDAHALPARVERVAFINRRLCIHRREDMVSGHSEGVPGFAVAPFAAQTDHPHGRDA